MKEEYKYDCVTSSQAVYATENAEEYVQKTLTFISDIIKGTAATGENQVSVFFPTSLAKKLSEVLLVKGFKVIKNSGLSYTIIWE